MAPDRLYSEIGRLKMELDWLKKSPGGACKRASLLARTGGHGASVPRPDKAIDMQTSSSELNDSLLTTMLPPNHVGVAQLAAETNIPRETRHGWRRQALGQARRPQNHGALPATLTSEEQFTVVMATATRNELELGAYCRRQGRFAAQITAWRQSGRQAHAPRANPAHRLAPSEHEAVLAAANAPRFARLSPHQSVPARAAAGGYLASKLTFYRLRRNANPLARRSRSTASARVRPPPLAATGPHQVWSWDITYLASTVQGMFCYLSLIMAVDRRQIVGG